MLITQCAVIRFLVALITLAALKGFCSSACLVMMMIPFHKLLKAFFFFLALTYIDCFIYVFAIAIVYYQELIN